MPFFAPPKRFLIVDGFNTLFRSHFAYQRNPLTCKVVEDGEERLQIVSALYGTLRTISSAIQNYGPERFVIALDSKGGNFRHEKYPKYKKDRKPIPEELPWQIHKLVEVLPELGWPVEMIKGYEADDIVATIVPQVKGDYDVYIMTHDKDLLQLVDTNVYHITRSTYGVQYVRGVDYVKKKFGISPKQIRDYLALKGDSADNLPGIKGIGDKTATKLLQKYGSLDKILQNAQDIKGKVGERLQNEADTAKLMYELVGLQTDAPIQGVENYEPKPPTEKALQILSELQFVSLIETMGLTRNF